MKTLVVFYSLDGNTKLISGKIAETLSADIIELKTDKKYPADGFFKYFLGGMSVMFGQKPMLTNSSIDLSPYDTIVIGTPIWASSFVPAIKSFVSSYKIKGKRIALFACHRGGGAEKCIMKLKAALPGNQFIGEADFVEPKNTPEESSAKAIKWAASLAV